MDSIVDPEKLDSADLDGVAKTWSDVLQEHFGTTAPDKFDRFDMVLTERPSDFLSEEIATHLESLEYLSATEGAGMTAETVWRPAFERWQADQLAAELQEAPPVKVSLTDENLAKASPEERAIRLLKAHSTFEGETDIVVTTDIGEGTLAGRIARHRLRAFGFLQPEAGPSAMDSAAREAVAEELTRPAFPAISFVNLLGDVPELTSRFVQTQHHRVFVFAKPGEDAEKLFTTYGIKRGSKTGLGQGTFRSDAARRRQERAGAVTATGEERAAELRPTIDPGLVQKKSAAADRPPAEFNRFGLYLLQVRLWMFGYYRGALDGQWGLMTARALLRFAEEHETGVGEKQALAARPKWMQGNSNRLVIDLCYLFSYMVARLDEAAEITARSEIDSLVQTALQSNADDAAAQKKISDAESDLTKELLTAHEKRREKQQKDREKVDGAGEASGGRRRRYFGWRAVFGFVGRALRWVGRSIKKALKWIREKISQLVHYATALVNYIREKTRRAMRLVALGFQRIRHWITGEPVGTLRGATLLATQSSLDFDTITVVQGPVDAEFVTAHCVRLDCLNAGFGFLVEIGLAVWSVLQALKFAIANWLLIAWRAYKAVRRALGYIDNHAELLDRLEPAVV